MTYLAFLLYFLVPPIALLVVWALVTGSASTLRSSVRPVGLVVVIALVYTAPWDNYLLYREVWWYGADRVVGTIGLVPVEEYTFMVLQTVMTGLFAMMLYSGTALSAVGRASRRGWVGLLVWMAVAAAGWVMVVLGGGGLYLGLILGWAGPVLGGLWWLGAPRYLAWPGRFVAAFAVPTVYLCAADALAIGSGIWEISDRFTTGLQLGVLPVEEAVFFLVTNLLVVKGTGLFR